MTRVISIFVVGNIYRFASARIFTHHTTSQVLVQAGEAWQDTELMKKQLLLIVALLMLTIAPRVQAAEDPTFGAGATPPPEVLKFLQEMKRQYGPDTVALVSWLLDAANHSGSVLTTAVKVTGNETKENSSFLVFWVDTGLILNENTTDQYGRLLAIWETILEKSFLHMDTIQVPADGVMVNLVYHHKSFPETDDLMEHTDEPGPIEEAKFYFAGDPLRAFMRKELSSQDLISRTHVIVDDKPIVFSLSRGAQKAETGILLQQGRAT
jgi:hypothetical protein